MKKISLILAASVLTFFTTISIDSLSYSISNTKLNILVHHKKIKKPILIDIKKPAKGKDTEIIKTDTQTS